MQRKLNKDRKMGYKAKNRFLMSKIMKMKIKHRFGLNGMLISVLTLHYVCYLYLIVKHFVVKSFEISCNVLNSKRIFDFKFDILGRWTKPSIELKPGLAKTRLVHS